jgi:hypothetical protein
MQRPKVMHSFAFLVKSALQLIKLDEIERICKKNPRGAMANPLPAIYGEVEEFYTTGF